ncbi:hypothetical protein HC891_01680 [Candidatus Gracilibacteria bacterium]|nr:hypothetical protein [Candidatus Gracilibacteria bacterium]
MFVVLLGDLNPRCFKLLLIERGAHVIDDKDLSAIRKCFDHPIARITIASIDHRSCGYILAWLAAGVDRNAQGCQPNNMREPIDRIDRAAFEPTRDQYNIGLQAQQRLHLTLDPRCVVSGVKRLCGCIVERHRLQHSAIRATAGMQRTPRRHIMRDRSDNERHCTGGARCH